MLSLLLVLVASLVRGGNGFSIIATGRHLWPRQQVKGSNYDFVSKAMGRISNSCRISETRRLLIRDFTLYVRHNNDDEEFVDPSTSSNRTETSLGPESFPRHNENFNNNMPDPVVVAKRIGKSSKKGKTGGIRNAEFKLLDERDALPFVIEQVTPDPYTHPDVKRNNAKKLAHKSGVSSMSSHRLYLGTEDGNEKTLIGEFLLDKLTTTGDLIEIGDIQYRVTRHKCQYKYVGGKRFVMVRKILQVKEVGRLLMEEYLTRQLERSSDEK